ncbi:hypothetical protein [uncultured Maribacter sp.]|uniref:hypothetical protein n=1 Tax=uncultured Maribacter sp. TaxID=431308 RepID=UPI0026133E8B|nr:hypothetical protein [uncultured Maribacter sp.]
MHKKVLFHEIQKLRQWWIWLIILAAFIFNLYFIIKPLLSSDHASSVNMSFSLIMPYTTWLFILLTLAVVVLLFFMKMTTVITEDKIAIKHMYVVKKDFLWEDIASAEIITYGFVGYGKRYSIKHGIVYNMRGNKGLAIKLKNGKKYLIGTQKEENLREVVRNIQNHT